MGLEKSCRSLPGTSKTESWVLGPLLPMMFEPLLASSSGTGSGSVSCLDSGSLCVPLFSSLPVFSLASRTCLVWSGLLYGAYCVHWHQFSSQPSMYPVGPPAAVF